MRNEVRELHGILLDLVAFMNQPRRDAALLREANVTLDRALFPLLVAVERRGPIGVVELADLVGRDYTTVSRQLVALERRKLVARKPSKTDKRSREAAVTSQGRKVIAALDAARQKMGAVLFADWSDRDIKELLRLMRGLADGLTKMP